MKTIEIRTTQNVVLQYELADLRERIVAFLIDSAILIFGLLILISIFGQVFTGTTLEALMYLCFAIYIFYSLLFETFNRGQTPGKMVVRIFPGKMVVRIRVVKTTSGQAAFTDYAARWVFRMVDIFFSLGGIASILIASSPKSQRIGDIVANTTVIKLLPQMNLTLKDILNIHSTGSYTPEYTQAKQLVEEDALLIKNTLDRFRIYNNQAHADALNMLADKIAAILRVPRGEKTKQQFLETVLKDYVMLTR
jgi:uncharacterized RDD family membrane protein YckC